MQFREKLKQIRESRGWTQADAARAAGVPFRSYQNWEAGQRTPQIGALAKLAAGFGITADELLAGLEGGAA